MHVGKGVCLQNLDGLWTDAEVLAHEFALADEAEAFGFGSIWFPEHHFSGYHIGPNVMQLLTYLAGRTTKVRLGSMVVVLPWHEPVRVTEELSVLDHLSGGRLMVGFGRGLGRVEFEGFRLNQGESRVRFTDYAESIVNAFDTGILTCDGELYQQPPVPIRPTPAHSLRGRVYASAVSPASIEIMARLGFGLMVIPQKPWAVTEAEVAQYHERYIEINGVAPPRPLLVTVVSVDESEARANEMYDRYIMRYTRSVIEHYEFGNLGLAAIPGYEYYGKLAEHLQKHGVDQYCRFLSDLHTWGTPAQVTEKLVENARRIDAAGVLAILSFGDMPPEMARDNQRLFARSVLPQLEATDSHRVLPDIPTLVGAV